MTMYSDACPISTGDIADRCLEVANRAIAGEGKRLSNPEDLVQMISDYLVDAAIEAAD